MAGLTAPEWHEIRGARANSSHTLARVRAIREADFGAFARRVLPHLVADPVRNNVACGLIENRRDGLVPIEPDGLWLWVRDADDALVGVAVMTPPHPLLLSDMPPVAIDALVARLAADGTRLPGVTGPIALANRFARAYADLTDSEAEPVMSLRMFRLDEVREPRGVPGRLREATTEDRDLLVDWSFAFGAEALPGQPADPERPIDLRLRRQGLLWLWEVDCQPVSTAYLTRTVAGVSRVSGVYTPPELRGRGYASGCVAGMSQYALDHGSIACMLYTDLANPTSNKIYQDIGYRPVADAQEWRFS